MIAVDTLSFEGRVAIVTGVGAGFAAQTALMLSRLGTRVAIVDSDAAGLDALATSIESTTGQLCLPLVADLAHEHAAKWVVRSAVEALGGLHVLIASVARPGAALAALKHEAGRLFEAQGSGAIVTLLPAIGQDLSALQAHMRGEAARWGPHGVRTNAIAYGAIAADPGVADLAPSLPLGRVGRPQEVANVAVFLASEAASYVTGAVVPVTGGL